MDEARTTFRELCEYPDGGRVLVETTLEVRAGKIARQVDAVAKAAREDTAPPDCLPGPDRVTEEDRSLK